MEKIVFTIREDICDKNIKTPEMVNQLKEVMTKYGTLVSFDTEIANVKADYQATINSLTSQLEAIRGNQLTEHEVALINCFRKICADLEAKKANDVNAQSEALVEANKKLEDTLATIKSLITK